jgi:sulfotransferase family protein
MKVVYIAGSGRSGSTIVDNILGQLDGWVSVGEVRFLWERGMVEDRRCGCGEPFSSCPFWQAVLARAFPEGTDPIRMRSLLERGTRARRIPSLVGRTRRRRFVIRELEELPQALASLYGAIAEVSGARVIVDSSKLPTYGAVLGEVPGIDLRVVHLIRDPRATAFSWLRNKALPDRPGTQMQRQRPFQSAALWTLWNTMAEVFWGRSPSAIRLRYEDVVGAPRAAIARIVAVADEPPDDGPFVSDTEVELAPAHGVAGNPSRFTTGRVALRSDDAWRTQMRRVDRGKVDLVTWPLLWRHGYAGRG